MMTMPTQWQLAEKSAAVPLDKRHQAFQKYVWMVLSALSLLLLMPHVSADETTPNLFAKHYKTQNAYQLKSLDAHPDTKLYVSNHKKQDNVTMLEKGYDMMGTTGFTASDVSPSLALAYGKQIKADTVLVYTKYSSAKAQASRKALVKSQAEKVGKVIDETLLDAETVYDYFASYWVKIPMPTFGVHVVKLRTMMTDPATDEVIKKSALGLKILAVIKGSAAAKAQIVSGDSLLQIGEVKMDVPDDLFTAVKRYKGQTAPVVIKRGRKVMTMPVTFIPVSFIKV